MIWCDGGWSCRRCGHDPSSRPAPRIERATDEPGFTLTIAALVALLAVLFLLSGCQTQYVAWTHISSLPDGPPPSWNETSREDETEGNLISIGTRGQWGRVFVEAELGAQAGPSHRSELVGSDPHLTTRVGIILRDSND